MRNLMLTVALALTFMALSAKPAHAIMCCDNDSSTGVYIGTGTTCAAAQSNLHSQVVAELPGDCGGPRTYCFFGITYLDDCYDSGGQLASQGYGNYGCKYICQP
jgi:hypothetical protein